MSLSNLKHVKISTTVFISCTLLITFCKVKCSTKRYFEYRKLKCKVDTVGLSTTEARSAMSCSNLCWEHSSCWAFHYQKSGSLCKIDTRSVSVQATEYNTSAVSSWISYLRVQYACDPHWTQLNESCYHVSPNYYTWTECLSYCQNNTSYLATIRNKEENNLAMDILYTLPLENKYLHLGGELNAQGAWVWVNGEPWDFTRWDRLEPTNRVGETCLAIFHIYAMLYWGQSEWNDVPRTALGYCLCEKSALVNFVEPLTACLTEK